MPIPWHGIARSAATLVAGSVGALVAVLADLIQKDAASATLRISNMAHQHLALSAPPIVWVGIMVLLGLGICFVQQPTTRQGAFYAGASIVALLMTVVPYREPLSRPAPDSPKKESAIRLASAEAGTMLVQAKEPKEPKEPTSDWSVPPGTSLLKLWIAGTPKAGMPQKPDAPARVTFSQLDEKGWPVARWEQTVPVHEHGIVFGLPAGAAGGVGTGGGGKPKAPTRFRITVEIPGYEITSKETLLQPSEQKELFVNLDSSPQPLWLQRLWKSPSSY